MAALAAVPSQAAPKRLLEQQADDCWEMRKARKQESAAASSSSSSVPPRLQGLGNEDWSAAEAAMQKQRRVAETKRQVSLAAPAGEVTPYVDGKAGLMRPKLPETRRVPSSAPLLPAEPTILLGTSKPAPAEVVPLHGTRVVLGQRANIVLVPSLLFDTAVPAALQARLDGSRLRDLSGRQIHYRGLRGQHFILYLSKDF